MGLVSTLVLVFLWQGDLNEAELRMSKAQCHEAAAAIVTVIGTNGLRPAAERDRGALYEMADGSLAPLVEARCEDVCFWDSPIDGALDTGDLLVIEPVSRD